MPTRMNEKLAWMLGNVEQGDAEWLLQNVELDALERLAEEKHAEAKGLFVETNRLSAVRDPVKAAQALAATELLTRQEKVAEVRVIRRVAELVEKTAAVGAPDRTNENEFPNLNIKIELPTRRHWGTLESLNVLGLPNDTDTTSHRE